MGDMSPTTTRSAAYRRIEKNRKERLDRAERIETERSERQNKRIRIGKAFHKYR